MKFLMQYSYHRYNSIHLNPRSCKRLLRNIFNIFSRGRQVSLLNKLYLTGSAFPTSHSNLKFNIVFLRLLCKTRWCLIENGSQNSCFTKLHLLLVYLYVWVYSICLCPCCDCRGNDNRNKMLNLMFVPHIFPE